MERKKIIIDGNNFSTLSEFFDETNRILSKDPDVCRGHNFSAFHDLLRGGFGVFEYGESVDFIWVNSEKSRADLGYDETVRYYERLLEKCHPSNRGSVQKHLDSAKNHEEATLFEMIVGHITDKTDSYDHTLSLDRIK